MAKKFKWVAFSHDSAYEADSEHRFTTKGECYNDMRNAVLEKMKWNTEFDEDLPDETDAVSYKVWFEQGMIVHQSYSGTYVFLIVNEDEDPDYYDVFSDEMVKRLQEIDMIDSAGVETIQSYQIMHKKQVEKEKKAELNSAMIELLKTKKDYMVIFPEGTYVTLEFCGEKNKEELYEIYTTPECGFKRAWVHSTPQSSHTEYTEFTEFSNEEMEMLLELCKKDLTMKVKLNKDNVSVEDIKVAKQVLIDNGVEADEADTVLQAIGYTLLDTELYPYPQCEEYRD